MPLLLQYLAGAVDVSAVVNVDDVDNLPPLVDAVEQAVGPPSGPDEACQVTFERLACPVRLASESAERELDDRGNDAWRDALQGTPCRTGELDRIDQGGQLSRLGTPNSARIAASPCVRPATTSASATVWRMPG